MTPAADVALAPLTTMGVGGPARWFVEARSESDVCRALAWARDRRLRLHVLGGGSNVVISDDGFDGLVIHTDIRGLETSTTDGQTVYAVGAGEPWDDVVGAAVRGNLAGLECLSGIPGLAGGTPVQNVGAYGQDVSATIARIRAIDRQTHRVVSFSNAECRFGYRSSRFKRDDVDRFIVTRVDFALTVDGRPTVTYADVLKYFAELGGGSPTLRQTREAILAIRRRKGMVIEEGNPANRSCGSFFVNPVVRREDHVRIQEQSAEAVPHYAVDGAHVKIPAAWLIEHAGFPKGTSRGAVGISPFQSQAIVNLGGALAREVFELACEVKRAVWEVFRVPLLPEPVFVGFAPSEQTAWLLGQQRSR